jgi:dimethylglycine dehydrogenase
MTIARLADDHFYVVVAAASELKILQHMEHYLPGDGSVAIRNVTLDYGVRAVIGPRSRDLLSKLTETDLSNEAFPYLAANHIHLGVVPTLALRINFAGELGWELHHKMVHQRTIYKNLLEAGKEFGLMNCGMRALLNSMRLEKGYLMASDICGEETPLQAGLDMFVRFDKGDFVGREALLKQKAAGIPTKMVCLVVDAGDADAYGDECIWHDGDVVGRVTSGGWGHRVEKSIALGYVRADLAETGTRLEVEIMDERRQAKVARAPVYDPENGKLRS